MDTTAKITLSSVIIGVLISTCTSHIHAQPPSPSNRALTPQSQKTLCQKAPVDPQCSHANSSPPVRPATATKPAKLPLLKSGSVVSTPTVMPKTSMPAPEGATDSEVLQPSEATPDALHPKGVLPPPPPINGDVSAESSHQPTP